ncbi:MAG: tetratricopeptide repeat protein [Planctomycetota bacterium]|nr:tetratricopeptide repeat protein [Planctomycetota bacterium]
MARKGNQRGKPDTLQTSAPHHRWILLALALVLLGLAAYHNSFSAVFLYDDHPWITRGDRIQYDLWPLNPFFEGTLRPFLFYSLAINYKIGGLSVTGYHVWNLAVHLVAALALFGIVRQTLRLPQFSETFRSAADGIAFAIAAIWLVHPLQTQAVTYVVQRSESMMGMFLLVGLYGVVRGAGSRPAWPWYSLAVVSVSVGMGCKPVMIVAPLLILLFDRVFLSASWQQLLRARWGLYLAILPAWLWLAWHAAPGVRSSVVTAPPIVEVDQRITPGVEPAAGQPAVAEPAAGQPDQRWQPRYRQFTPWQYARTQAEVILHYLRLVFWPHPLCLDYDPWPVPSIQQALVPGLIVVGLLIAGLLAMKFAPAIGFLLIGFFLVLAPSSSFLPIRHVAFEHRMYIPSAAVIALAVLATYAILMKLPGRDAVRPATAGRIAGGLLAVTLVGLVTATVSRNEDYRDAQRMWASVVAVQPDNVGAINNLAQALYAKGQTQAALEMLRRGEQLQQHHPAIQASMGDLLVKEGEKQQSAGHGAAANAMFREAARRCQRALLVWPHDATVHFNTGVAYEKLGIWDQAIQHYRQAIQFRPRDVVAHINLGVVLSHSGQADEALKAYRRALQIDPANVNVLSNFGVTLAQQKQFNEATQHLQRATELDPHALHVWENLTLVYADAGQYRDAINTARQAATVARKLGYEERARQIEQKIREYELRQRGTS